MSNYSSLESWNALQSTPNTHLIDIRTPEEWKETGIADLSSLDKEVKLISWILLTPTPHVNINFIAELNKTFPDKNDSIYFICRSGARSTDAVIAAIQNGYKNSHNANEGFNGWMDHKLPTRAA